MKCANQTVLPWPIAAVRADSGEEVFGGAAVLAVRRVRMSRPFGSAAVLAIPP
jgi:hypothetical protein